MNANENSSRKTEDWAFSSFFTSSSLPSCLPPFFADLFHSFLLLHFLPSGWLVVCPFLIFFLQKKKEKEKTLLLNFFGEPRRFYKSMNQSRRPPPSPISVTQRKKISCLLTTLVLSMQQTRLLMTCFFAGMGWETRRDLPGKIANHHHRPRDSSKTTEDLHCLLGRSPHALCVAPTALLLLLSARLAPDGSGWEKLASFLHRKAKEGGLREAGLF
uniref:Transmembrane protein n=1 Tax=Micrurus corallinus TaxID=54390 RepID=A0A2D4G0R7_MICCO